MSIDILCHSSVSSSDICRGPTPARNVLRTSFDSRPSQAQHTQQYIKKWLLRDYPSSRTILSPIQCVIFRDGQNLVPMAAIAQLGGRQTEDLKVLGWIRVSAFPQPNFISELELFY